MKVIKTSGSWIKEVEQEFGIDPLEDPMGAMEAVQQRRQQLLRQENLDKRPWTRENLEEFRRLNRIIDILALL